MSPHEITFAFPECPLQGYQVVVTSTGSQIFLEFEGAHYLGDNVLDVQRGQDGDLHFVVARKR